MNDNGFAAKLRWWRAQRGVSQLDLALRGGISQRHLSFLELGRAKPSREMVEQIASALDIPLRQHNALLVAAGYAPVWRETNLDAAELSDISEALNHMMAQQEPYPAAVVDRRWNLLRANQGAVRLVEFLTGPIATRRENQSSRCTGGAGHTAAASFELEGGGPLLHPKRGS